MTIERVESLKLLWTAIRAAGYERSACLPVKGGTAHILVDPWLRARYKHRLEVLTRIKISRLCLSLASTKPRK